MQQRNAVFQAYSNLSIISALTIWLTSCFNASNSFSNKLIDSDNEDRQLCNLRCSLCKLIIAKD